MNGTADPDWNLVWREDPFRERARDQKVVGRVFVGIEEVSRWAIMELMDRIFELPDIKTAGRPLSKLSVSVQGEVTTLGAAAMRRPPCQPCER